MIKRERFRRGERTKEKGGVNWERRISMRKGERGCREGGEKERKEERKKERKGEDMRMRGER